MTIAKVHTRGLPPLDDPVAGAAIEARLLIERKDRDEEHAAGRADPARFTASDAYACARKVAFGRLGVPKDITYDQAQLMTFKAGDWYHQVTQEALVQWLDCRCEVDFDWRPTFSIYGRGDGLYEDSDARTVVEIKSQAGFGFDLAVGARRSAEGPGPKIDHLIQAGLFALCPTIGATRAHIIYINKDRGSVAEWIIGVDDELPHLDNVTIRGLVDDELKRLALIATDLDDGDLPARMVPGYGLVDDPPEKDSRDNPWNCRYCPWQPTCAALPTDRVDGWVAAFMTTKAAS